MLRETYSVNHMQGRATVVIVLNSGDSAKVPKPQEFSLGKSVSSNTFLHASHSKRVFRNSPCRTVVGISFFLRDGSLVELDLRGTAACAKISASRGPAHAWRKLTKLCRDGR